MITANFIVKILLIGYLIYIIKKINREEIEIQESMVQRLKILDEKVDFILKEIDEKVDFILKETDDMLNKLYK